MVNGEIEISLPKDVSIEELKSKMNLAWDSSMTEFLEIAQRNGVDLSQMTEEELSGISNSHVRIEPVGGGVELGTIVLLISLAPLIKALSPVLKPFAQGASKVSEKIALDIWEHLKSKLWNDSHIALKEKKKKK